MIRAFKSTGHVDYGEVARLAFAAWQKEGAMPGREFLYWAEAENHLLATNNRLLAETRLRTPPGSALGLFAHRVPPALRAA